MKNFNYQDIQTQEEVVIESADFNSRVYKIYHAIKNDRLSIEYKLKVAKNYLSENSKNSQCLDKMIHLIEITNSVIEKYEGFADFILKDYFKTTELFNLIILALPLIEGKQYQLLEEVYNEFFEKHKLIDLLRKQEFYRFQICEDEESFIIHRSDFQRISPATNNKMLLSTGLGNLEIHTFWGLEEITPIEFLEIKNITLLDSFSLQNANESFFKQNFLGPEYLLLTENKIKDFNNSVIEIHHNDKPSNQERTMNMNATDVENIFQSFSKEVTENEIREVLGDIKDTDTIAEIMDRVSTDYNKILAVFDDVGRDGLDIDIIITCLYVELKAKWIQLNLQSQYRAFKGLPTDMAALGHASVSSLFLAKIEPYLESGFIAKINDMLSEPIAA